MKLVLVAGTGTEVGKTWVAAALLGQLRARGRRVAVRKPIQSFDPADPQPTDAEVLASATGEQPTDVCPSEHWLPVPMAPPMAAAVLGLPSPDTATLVAGISWPTPRSDFGLVESVGGVRSPLAPDGDTVSLAEALEPDVVLLVADAALGTIDRVRLAVEALGEQSVVVFLNHFDETDDLHVRNREWLMGNDGFAVVTDVDDLADRFDPGA